MSDQLLNALVSRMRQARRFAKSFEAAGHEESCEMWCETYEQLEAVLYDLVESRDDEWVTLIKTLRAEWN